MQSNVLQDIDYYKQDHPKRTKAWSTAGTVRDEPECIERFLALVQGYLKVLILMCWKEFIKTSTFNNIISIKVTKQKHSLFLVMFFFLVPQLKRNFQNFLTVAALEYHSHFLLSCYCGCFTKSYRYSVIKSQNIYRSYIFLIRLHNVHD